MKRRVGPLLGNGDKGLPGSGNGGNGGGGAVIGARAEVLPA